MVDRSPSFIMNPTPIAPQELPDLFRIDDLDDQLQEVKQPANLQNSDDDFRARWWNVKPAGKG